MRDAEKTVRFAPCDSFKVTDDDPSGETGIEPHAGISDLTNNVAVAVCHTTDHLVLAKTQFAEAGRYVGTRIQPADPDGGAYRDVTQCQR
jgi:hypothetical protein